MKSTFTISLICLFGVNLALATEERIVAPRERLEQGQTISSADGRCTLLLQNDGNLVVQKDGQNAWSSGSFNQPPFNTHDTEGPFFLKLQKRGAMVVRNRNGDAVYVTDTRNMELDDDEGGLFFNQDCTITIKANNERYDIWTNVRSTFYAGNRLARGEMIKYPPIGDDTRHTLILQNDGNLILFEGEDRSDYNGPSDILWGAGTTSDTNADHFYLKFTCDGRLILNQIVSGVTSTYWSMQLPSGDAGVPTATQGYSLILQNNVSAPFVYDVIDAGCQTSSYTQERFIKPPRPTTDLEN